MSFETLHKEILKRHYTIKKEQNLDAIKAALFALGNPQDCFKTVHVAGTNGKGSVCAMMANILAAAGYKTGLFTSPHLISPRERIQINGKNISARAFENAIKKVLLAEQTPLNYFEILTAAVFYYFKKNKVDYAVIEAGIGGLLDATNVITPSVSIITSVDYDHKDILGNTLQKIAAQKAGIIKRGVPCVCGELPKTAKNVVIKTARAAKVPLYFAAKPSNIRFVPNKNLMRFTVSGRTYESGICGAKQPLNAAVCAQAAKLLAVKPAAVKKGLRTANLRARFEIIKTPNSTLIIDGAHNPQAMRGVIENIKLAGFNPTLVFAAMKDKDYRSMLQILRARFKKIIFAALNNPRAAVFPNARPTQEIIKQALSGALGKSVLFTGSFYLAGEADRLIDRR
ncbi:MAG: bifunctional folylpolyglutamate synthase/dihydrofolate synthase [Elusimicrobium sp.]|jgi:dihydrofolate synthase/folylpolyglutamate synthase|nr:bifunctional folylpolyglutamate synthase/dihydrofolate synthase [Elusimicrobium sp.]